MPTEDDVEKVTGVPVDEAKEKALDKAEDVTPDSVTPDPAPPADPVPDPTEGDKPTDTVTTALAAMATQIKTLEDTVAELVKPDDSPVKKGPWTKRGRKR